MSQNVLLISDEILKDRTAVHGNIDAKLLYPEIKTAQDIEKAEDREQEVVAKRKEAGEYVKRHIDLILASSSVSEVNGIQKATIRHLERQKLIREIADICDAGIKKIGIEAESKKLLITGAKQ